MALGEFDLIRRFFSRPTAQTLLPGGDDAALLQPSAGMQLAVSTDMLVAGRHFLPDTDPYRLGWKTLAVNLSDLAAMGARPRWATLSLALPEVDESWLEAFASGFYDLAGKHNVDLVGGDTTRGPLTLCVQIMGEVAPGAALQRNRAQPGDLVWVSGTLGMAAAGLAHLQGRLALPDTALLDECTRKLEQPEPRVQLGLALQGRIACAMDISDGLLGDLGHILDASGVGAQLDVAALPVPAGLRARLNEASVRHCVLSGGDDYELLFTAPAEQNTTLRQIARELGVTLTCIGRITAEPGLQLCEKGLCQPIHPTGYDHFAP